MARPPHSPADKYAERQISDAALRHRRRLRSGIGESEQPWQQSSYAAAKRLELNKKFNISLEAERWSYAPSSVSAQVACSREYGERSSMVSREFIRQLEGYGLTTATILYRLPDHPRLLQSYIWQEYDLAPKFPILLSFLEFWKRELEGPLHSVTVAHSRLIKPAEFQSVDGIFTLH
jgi:uncharacterized protein Usg